MDFPRWQDFTLPLLTIAADGTPRRRKDFDESQIADDLDIPIERRGELTPKGSNTRMADRIDWAAWHLKKAGFLSNQAGRGTFTITQRGREALAMKPHVIDIKFLLRYSDFAEYWTGQVSEANADSTLTASTSVDEQEETPEERLQRAWAELQGRLKADLIENFLNHSPKFFERAVLDLLVAMGYGDQSGVIHTGGSGDGGIDGEVREDTLGLDVIYVQAKRYSSAVPREAVHSFMGSLHMRHAQKGVFITTATFSKAAYEDVKQAPGKIVLIDGQKFADLCVEHGIGVTVDRPLTLKKIDGSFFQEED